MLLIVALGDIGDRAALPAILRRAARSRRRSHRGDRGVGTLERGAGRARAVGRDERCRCGRRRRGTRCAGPTEKRCGQRGHRADARRGVGRRAGRRSDLPDSAGLRRPCRRCFVWPNGPTWAKPAMKALGATVSIDDLPKLIALATAAENAGRQAAARRCAMRACGCRARRASRSSWRPCRARRRGRRSCCWSRFRRRAGRRALQEIVAAARSRDDALQDAATRLLGGWMTPDAGPRLLELSKTLAEPEV